MSIWHSLAQQQVAWVFKVHMNLHCFAFAVVKGVISVVEIQQTVERLFHVLGFELRCGAPVNLGRVKDRFQGEGLAPVC
jgi:hypothetical protein